MDRIPIGSPRRIVDLGCGTGNITRRLAERWPEAQVEGIDNAASMLDVARAEAPSDSVHEITWREADIATWRPDEPVDLIYANAALHWVPDHGALFPRLVGFLAGGGCLAVQMPLSFSAPSHRLMRETLATGGEDGAPIGTDDLRTRVSRRWVDETTAYYDVLASRVQWLDIWETEYLQILEGEDPVLEWVSGTGLRPILDGLDDGARAVFTAEYRRRLARAYPRRPDGRTVYPFRRLFMVAAVSEEARSSSGDAGDTGD